MDKPKNFKELKQRLLPFINYEQSIQLNNESKVQNVGNMINSHVKILEANPGNAGFLQFLKLAGNSEPLRVNTLTSLKYQNRYLLECHPLGRSSLSSYLSI